jgi:hypothetical protein
MNTSSHTPQKRSQAFLLLITTTLVSFFWFPMPSAQAWLFPFLFRAAVRSAVINGVKKEIQSSRQRCTSNPKACHPIKKRLAKWKKSPSSKSRLRAATAKKPKNQQYHRPRTNKGTHD